MNATACYFVSAMVDENTEIARGLRRRDPDLLDRDERGDVAQCPWGERHTAREQLPSTLKGEKAELLMNNQGQSSTGGAERSVQYCSCRAFPARDQRITAVPRNIRSVLDRGQSGRKNLLQLRIFRLGLLQDGDVRIGVFPEREEIFVGGEGATAGVRHPLLARFSPARHWHEPRPDAPTHLFSSSRRCRCDRESSGIQRQRR